MEALKMTKTHRVGTITLGGMLITFGTLFLLRIFVTTISYHIIFKLWPIIFILLGIEVLLANFKQKEVTLVYDKTAFALIIILSFFAMGMSIAEFAMTQINYELINHINY
jgi:UDP-N-acetylmuramyl pentapeptide phosphotransferase/UDP-N-acetylglucosamine-1-phosphate transferase